MPVFKGFLTTSTFGAYMKDIELAEEVSKELANPEFVERQRAELIWKTLKQLPADEANEEASFIKKDDLRMFNRLDDIKKSEKEGINSMQRIAQRLGVANGERALFIVEQLNLIDIKEGKNELFSQLVKNKIITDKVKKQILHFKKTGQRSFCI